MTASLYIHIPFCASLCDYCDFFSVPINAQNDVNVINTFIDVLLCDIEEQLAFFRVDHVPTVYIGGGTPSVLPAARMERLLAGIRALLKPMKGVIEEFTVEANPESADEAFLQTCASCGVSRISLGVQTFHDPSRRAVSRLGDGALSEKRLAQAVHRTARYFPGAFSVDLITGLPYQTEAIVREDIERALAFRPGHISLYSLTLEPRTPLGERVTRHGAAALSLPCGDEADALWITGRDALENAGFAQYEVSSFALPGKTCAHNIRYWRMENWLGAGPAASGTIIDDEVGTGRRFTYPADIEAYIAAPNISHGGTEDTEELDRDSLIRETLLMGFRYRGGPDPVSFKRRFGCSIEDLIPQTVNRWREWGFFDAGQSGLAPSPNGLLFLNAFLRDAFGEL
jgi:oxygen-independent coproporphyrinogen-3 oxidase